MSDLKIEIIKHHDSHYEVSSPLLTGNRHIVGGAALVMCKELLSLREQQVTVERLQGWFDEGKNSFKYGTQCPYPVSSLARALHVWGFLAANYNKNCRELRTNCDVLIREKADLMRERDALEHERDALEHERDELRKERIELRQRATESEPPTNTCPPNPRAVSAGLGITEEQFRADMFGLLNATKAFDDPLNGPGIVPFEELAQHFEGVKYEKYTPSVASKFFDRIVKPRVRLFTESQQFKVRNYVDPTLGLGVSRLGVVTASHCVRGQNQYWVKFPHRQCWIQETAVYRVTQ